VWHGDYSPPDSEGPRKDRKKHCCGICGCAECYSAEDGVQNGYSRDEVRPVEVVDTTCGDGYVDVTGRSGNGTVGR
jgi:hypothetical protein